MKRIGDVLPSSIVLVIAQLVASTFLTFHPAAAADRDILWNIISNCVDTSAKDYCAKCTVPRAEFDCRTCRTTTDIWAETADYVVLRDSKSCDCPSGFVHALAIPRSRVTGFEDPQRPDGIWKFAWDTGLKKLKENELALAVNPKSQRSQDQLHVHIVRVIRENLPRDPKLVATVGSLNDVWYAAAKKAADLKWKDYGVLVTKGGDGNFLVVVDNNSPEFDYTIAQCGGPKVM